jgi:hypothetical protein
MTIKLLGEESFNIGSAEIMLSLFQTTNVVISIRYFPDSLFSFGTLLVRNVYDLNLKFMRTEYAFDASYNLPEGFADKLLKDNKQEIDRVINKLLKIAKMRAFI